MTNLRRLAANPNYITRLDALMEQRKATAAFNDYMMRSVGGRSGMEWHTEYEAAMRAMRKEKDPKTREQGLLDLTRGEKFGKHFTRITELINVKTHWDRIVDKLGASMTDIEVQSGAMPDWRRRLSDPFYDDPDRSIAPKVIRKVYATSGLKKEKVLRGGNELYKGLAS